MDRKTILIVDDAPANITVLKGVLEGTYGIKAATSGQVALKILKSQAKPDLILLDIVMPGMDGYEVCRQIKGDPSSAEIPIIFVTSNTSPEEIARGFEVGGVDYVTKPYNPKELLARIKTHLQLRDALEKMRIMANKLGKYLSPDVYDSIFTGAQDVRIESSKKFLTVCFSDIVQFTPQAEKMSQEELTSWLNNYLNRMAGITLSFGGTLDKFIGDAVMVFFGDPKTRGREEDAVQCVSMAKAMVEEAKRLNIDIRVGVNSGECVVGNFGSENRMDYTIIGKDVNAGQRLESNAEPNRILISESTYRLIQDKIPCSHRGEIQVKGMARAINAYWVD